MSYILYYNLNLATPLIFDAYWFPGDFTSMDGYTKQSTVFQ